MRVLDRLLRPRSVAVVGASADPAKLTGRPLAYLEKYGFTGQVYPVNPRAETIGKHRCYSDIAALPHSHTGRFLAPLLATKPQAEARKAAGKPKANNRKKSAA